MSGIKIKTTDKNMHKPTISALADGATFVYDVKVYMKITISGSDKWALSMETGKIINVPPDCEVEVVELHCEVVKANPYHHCKNPKVTKVEEREWTGDTPQPHMSEEKIDEPLPPKRRKKKSEYRAEVTEGSQIIPSPKEE